MPHILQALIKLVDELHIYSVLKIDNRHIRLADATHIVCLKNKIIVPDSPSYKSNVFHKVLGESVLCTSEGLFFVRFLHRPGRVFTAVYNYYAVQTLHKQRHQTCVQLRQHLIIAVNRLLPGQSIGRCLHAGGCLLPSDTSCLRLYNSGVQEWQRRFYKSVAGGNPTQ